MPPLAAPSYVLALTNHRRLGSGWRVLVILSVGRRSVTVLDTARLCVARARRSEILNAEPVRGKACSPAAVARRLTSRRRHYQSFGVKVADKPLKAIERRLRGLTAWATP